MENIKKKSKNTQIICEQIVLFPYGNLLVYKFQSKAGQLKNPNKRSKRYGIHSTNRILGQDKRETKYMIVTT
jgi:hypothetical protein